jgi:chromosome segregation ATPase
VGVFRSRSAEVAEQRSIPRDVESLEQLISDLEKTTDESAEATQKVTDQIAGIQTSAKSVSTGIHTTSETIGRMDAVQARINEVLEEQATMARAFER